MMSIFSKNKISTKYIVYKMFSWDLLFYYGIIFLFLNKTKGFSAANIFLGTAFYYLFKLLFQIGSTRIINIFGKRKSIFIGNIFTIIGILVLIFCTNLEMLILKNLFIAVGFSLKNICEPSYLLDMLPENEHRYDNFAKIDSRGSAYYFWFDAISSVVAGFLFILNSYLPIILCLIFAIISTIISYTFDDVKISNEQTNNEKHHVSTLSHIKTTLKTTKFIFNSNRLRSLLLFSGVFSAALLIFRTYMNSLLTDLNVPDEYFGFIAALIQVFSAISSNKQYYFHKKYRNRTLTVLALPIFVFTLITGLFVICDLPVIFVYISFGVAILAFSISKGPYYTLLKRYLNSFTTSSFNAKVYAASGIMENCFAFLMFIFSSLLLEKVSTSIAIVLFSGSVLIALLLLLDYMKSRLGLKPEEYSKKDINYIQF